MDPYVGEIRLFSFPSTPQGWLPCDGRTLPISTNQGLFALLGTNYGGDGKATFGLPDLRGRTPVNQGQGKLNAAAYQLGKVYGVESVTLTQAQMPQHIHTVSANTGVGTATVPTSNFFAGTAGKQNLYVVPTPTVAATVANLPAATLVATGGNGAHENRQPFTVIQFCIATVGLWPPRN